jgi:hypothetical protein
VIEPNVLWPCLNPICGVGLRTLPSRGHLIRPIGKLVFDMDRQGRAPAVELTIGHERISLPIEAAFVAVESTNISLVGLRNPLHIIRCHRRGTC